MADLRRIEGLPPAAAEALRGIPTVEALWKRLARPSFPAELAALAETAKIEPSKLRTILAADAAHRRLDGRELLEADPAPAAEAGHLRRHLPDVVAVVGLLTLVAALWPALTRVPAARELVVTAGAIPAGWVLTADDLTTAEVRSGEGLEATDAALGRVTLQPLAAGEVVRKRDLGLRVPPSMLVVHLPLAEQGLALRPGETVSLVVPLGPQHRAIIDRAIVLRVESDGATFAVDASDRAVVGRLTPGAAAIPFRPSRFGRRPSPPNPASHPP